MPNTTLINPSSGLMQMYNRVCELSDLQTQVAREVRHSQAMCDRLEEEALISGAMPGDFKIMMRFKRFGRGSRLTPELR